MLPLRFVPYHLLADEPNVVVDGSPGPATVLTLSHWPGSPTPVDLRADLSAQIAFHALHRPHLFDGVDVVTNNHFDQDGLAAAFALVDPTAGRARRDTLIDVARAGDFATFESRAAARVSMAIAASADPARSPLDTATFEGEYAARCGRMYLELLPRLGEMLDHPDRYRALWADEDAHLDAGLAAIADRTVGLTERADVDLATVTIPDGPNSGRAHRFAHQYADDWTNAVHPMAINNATSMLRVLLVNGRRYRLELRYESWVMLTSRPVAPRPDLRVLAERLDHLEPATARWTADPPTALTPFLRLVDDAESGLSPDTVGREVVSFLAVAPPAWDPFAGTGH